MSQELTRIIHPMMEYYREVYKDSKRCDSDPFGTVLVYMEQGFGDQIMFLRFLPFLAAKAKKVILHAPVELHRIIRNMGYDCFDKNDPNLPEHDMHVLSLSLPFMFGFQVPLEPYIKVAEKTEIPSGINIGIAWEGSPAHQYNSDRNCPLKHFKALQGNLYCLQPIIHDSSLLEGAEDMKLNGVELTDFYDTAKLINSLDCVVTVDTSVLHLAGAMGKKCFGLLSEKNVDPRWNLNWYPSVKLIKGEWDAVVHCCSLHQS